MKKKNEKMKTLQLLLTVLIAVFSLVIILTDKDLYQMVGRNPSVRMLCLMLWLSLVLAFVAIYTDFRVLSHSASLYRELDFSVSNDPVAGIANRYSCDSIIERYADVPLPDTVGCVMLEISNLGLINQNYGHTMGNSAIQAFSDVLSNASVGLCFVGRNGGNKFLALFEDCTDVKMNAFLTRVRQKLEARKLENGALQIEYRYGTAFHEGASIVSITQLIALADRRISNRKDSVTGMANRNGCDEIIEHYFSKPLPETMTCVMIDFLNLKEINDSLGRQEGNRRLKQFSDILRDASRDRCFVGRNGGKKFMALFEANDKDQVNAFLNAVKENTALINDVPDQLPIRFSWGYATKDEGLNDIGALLSKADAHISDYTNI